MPGASGASIDGRSEERLRLVLQATRAGIWDTHLGTGETYVSERFEEIFGFPAGGGPRSLGAFVRHVVPEHRDRVIDMMRASVQSGEPFVHDCRILDARGVERWLHIRGDVIVNERRRATRVFGTVVEVTEHTKERLAREEQDRFVAGVNAALPLIVFVFDSTAQRVVFVNRSLAEVLGYADEDFHDRVGSGMASLLHPEDFARVPEIRQRIAALADGAVAVFDLRARHRDGGWRWIRSRSTPLRLHPDGRLWQFIGTVEDITEQVHAEERRREQERELARAQELAKIGSWTYHYGSGKLSWSAEYYRIIGLDPDAVAPSEAALVPIISAEDRERLRNAHRAAIAGGAPVDVQYRITRPDGVTRHVHALAELLYGPDGTPTSIVGTMQDITEDVERAEERARLEAQLHHTQKLESLGLLAGGIAHDFNNLLVGVLSNASLALLDLDERSPAREVVLDIERTAQRAAELTRQLLAYSGKGRFVVEPLDLGDLAAEMASLLRAVMHKDAKLVVEPGDGSCVIEGDATQLRQVIMNLITNASDALQGQVGTITVRTTGGISGSTRKEVVHFGEIAPGTNVVRLEVSDTGVGMLAEIAERMFDPFFSTKFTGRGLGLAATLGIVRGHRGRVGVATSPGAGSRFELTFPAANRMVAQERVETRTPSAQERGRVLVVDDDSVVRSVSAALLTRRGFVVDSVADGHEALERFATSADEYRFVLLDITMPGLSGIEVLQRMRAEERENSRSPITVFLMSGYSAQDVTRDLGDLVSSGFLQKPFTLSDLDALLSMLDDQS